MPTVYVTVDVMVFVCVSVALWLTGCCCPWLQLVTGRTTGDFEADVAGTPAAGGVTDESAGAGRGVYAPPPTPVPIKELDVVFALM